MEEMMGEPVQPEDDIPDLLEFFDSQVKQGSMIPAMSEQVQGIAAAMQNLNQGLIQIAQILEQLKSLQEQTLAAIQAPRTVSIGGVQKDSAGNITGARVNSRVLN